MPACRCCRHVSGSHPGSERRKLVSVLYGNSHAMPEVAEAADGGADKSSRSRARVVEGEEEVKAAAKVGGCH